MTIRTVRLANGKTLRLRPLWNNDDKPAKPRRSGPVIRNAMTGEEYTVEQWLALKGALHRNPA